MLHMTEKEFEALTEDRGFTTLWGEPVGLSVMEEFEQKKGKLRTRNRESSARGQAFEELIILQCRKYKDDETAVIDKTPEPFRVYKKKPGGMFEGRFTGAKAQPDFQGTLKGGQSILIEAKSTGKDRIMFNAVTGHQQELLDMHSKVGAVCLILCEIRDRHFSVPWITWKHMKALYGHLYVNAKDIAEYEIKPEDGSLLPFLSDIVLDTCKAG